MDKQGDFCYNECRGMDMEKNRKKEIIDLAIKVREDHNVGLNAPIEEIANFCHKNYGCNIDIISFKEKIHDTKYYTLDALARLNPETKKLDILLNKDKHNSMNKIRFTIAHELGHYLLNHFEDNAVLARGDEINLFNTKNEEQEANLFAAEILLPSTALEGNINVERVAKYYEVSPQVVQYRKADLERK